jgi:aryl-alcohol dehydrogenase-like predicted oxidoreductase
MPFEARKLANDTHTVLPFGIGGGHGIRMKALDLAFEKGINYFFWAPTFPTYRNETKWLKEKFKTQRDKLILATCPYFWKFPGSLGRIIDRHRRWLGTDYIDYFHLGMMRTVDDRAYDELLKFKEKGAIKHIAFSCHDRKIAAQAIQKWKQVDLAMIRYNAAHIGAETEFFPHVDPAKISIVAFNTTRHGSMFKAPKSWDKSKPVPAAIDAFRFVLTNPKVTICLVGVVSEDEVNGLFKAMEKGPLDAGEMKRMREFGDAVYGRNQ